MIKCIHRNQKKNKNKIKIRNIKDKISYGRSIFTMKMGLDEVIEYYEKVVDYTVGDRHDVYLQLIEWLKELKVYRSKESQDVS